MSETIWSEPEAGRSAASLVEDASRRARAYLEGLRERPVAASAADVAQLRTFLAAPLPEAPVPAAQVLDEIDRYGGPATVASAGPRFFGFVNGGTLPASLAAHWLASAWDQNAFSWASSPVGAGFEAAALAWLIELFELPSGTEAAFTTGATLANFSALAAARHRLLAREGWDVEADGLFGAPPIEVHVSAESHPTVRKGLGLLGLGRTRVDLLETDAQGRIRADRLPRFGPRAIVCAQAGNVNSGAFDPFPALVDACGAAGAWLHVDGAFGLWARAGGPSRRTLTRGIEGADSWATDGHKWLNVPYDCGIAFVKDAEALRRAMSFAAAYLPADGPREPFHSTPEASRRARGIDVWAALRSLGRSGLEAMIERGCAQASRFAEGLRAAGHAVLNDVVLNQVVVCFGNDARTARVIEAVQAEGVCWCGPTEWRGRRAMRISVSCWATRDADVERALASILAAAERVEGAAPA
jgi:glutamate/tyrosine decarboxylase-like PLP-dependent enzyme